MKKAIFAALIFAVLFAPAVSFAAGMPSQLVPASPGTPGADQSTGYNLCDLRTLANNIIDFAVVLSVFVATLMFAYGGILYVTGPAGGEAQIKKAHAVFLNALIGILIVLLAWLMVNIVMSVLTNGTLEFWTTFTCEKNPVTDAFPAATYPAASAPNVAPAAPNGPVNAPTGSCVATSQALAMQVNASAACNPAQRVAGYGSGTAVISGLQNKYGGVINQCASQQGIPPSVLTAIAAVECGTTGVQKGTCGDPTGVGQGISGVSVSEVRTYCAHTSDPSCSGISGASTSQANSIISSNQQLAFCATAYDMKGLYNQYGDWALAATAYNGGSSTTYGPLAPSHSCPGYTMMQCPIGSGANPWCNTTCAYHDIFTNYMAAAGGTGADFENYFRQYMAAADAFYKTP